jgi:hypothetical protein
VCGTIKIMKRDFWNRIRLLGHMTLLVFRGFKMFDKDGNYITHDDEAIEFEELDFEELVCLYDFQAGLEPEDL